MSTTIQMTKTLYNSKQNGNAVKFHIKTEPYDFSETTSLSYKIYEIDSLQKNMHNYDIANTCCEGNIKITNNLLYMTFNISASPQGEGLGTLLLDCVFILIEEIELTYHCTFHSLRGMLSHFDKPYKWEASIPFYLGYSKRMSDNLKYSSNITSLLIREKNYFIHEVCSLDMLHDTSNAKKYILFMNSKFLSKSFELDMFYKTINVVTIQN